jgi:Protein of unknown function (DUF2778)
MMLSTSRVCELSTYNFDTRPQTKKNTLQNLIGGVALIWVAGACSWTVISNINGSAEPASRNAPAVVAVRNANAMVAAAHNEFSAARNQFASARAAFAIAAQQKFATALRNEPAAMHGKLASYVALIDDVVLDARGPIATLGGRLTDDIAPRSDRLMVASADPQAVIVPSTPSVKQIAQSIPLPARKPSELRIRPEPKETASGTAMSTKPAALAIAAATANDSAKDDAPSSIFSGLKHIASLAYAPSDGGLSRDKITSLAALRGDDHAAAVYDISAHMVYMPDGTKLEAHSGYGEYLDDPSHVSKRMRGATPPHTYDLSLRESMFHGVQAIRLTPVGGDDEVFGRDGLLAHTYMLGPRGDSNGCVSFRNYEAFLNAYRNNEVKRLVVVAHLS